MKSGVTEPRQGCECDDLSLHGALLKNIHLKVTNALKNVPNTRRCANPAAGTQHTIWSNGKGPTMSIQRNCRLSLCYVMSVAFFLSVFAASVADARVEFRGGGNVYDFDGCEEFDWDGTDNVLARYRPSGLPGNSNNTFLTMFWGPKFDSKLGKFSICGFPML